MRPAIHRDRLVLVHCFGAASFSTVVPFWHLFKGLSYSNNDKWMTYTNDPTSFHMGRAVEHLMHNRNKTGDTASLQKDKHTRPKVTGFSNPHRPSQKPDSRADQTLLCEGKEIWPSPAHELTHLV